MLLAWRRAAAMPSRPPGSCFAEDPGGGRVISYKPTSGALAVQISESGKKPAFESYGFKHTNRASPFLFIRQWSYSVATLP